MNKISILLLVMIAFAVALVVGLLVIAPDGAVENPPGRGIVSLVSAY